MSLSERFTLRVAVYLFLIRDNRIFLLRRANTSWANGYYTPPAGHFDGKETIIDATIREAQEEVGITLNHKDIKIVHAMHHVSNVEYIDYFLIASKWQGVPKNTEPDKCDDAQWFPINHLPEKLLPHVKRALTNYQKGISFSEEKWDVPIS